MRLPRIIVSTSCSLLLLLVISAPAKAQTTLPDATVGQSYNQSLGVTPPCSLTSGAIPPGLSLTSTILPTNGQLVCALAGTPTTAGAFQFTVKDFSGNSHTYQIRVSNSTTNFTLTITPSVSVATDTRNNGTVMATIVASYNGPQTGFGASIAGPGAFSISPSGGSIGGSTPTVQLMVSLNVNGVPPGNYQGTYTINLNSSSSARKQDSPSNLASGNSASGTFTVTKNALLLPNPPSLSYSFTSNSPQTQNLAITEAGNFSVLVSASYSGQGSVNVSPLNGNTAINLQVTGAPGNLAPGTSGTGAVTLGCVTVPCLSINDYVCRVRQDNHDPVFSGVHLPTEQCSAAQATALDYK